MKIVEEKATDQDLDPRHELAMAVHHLVTALEMDESIMLMRIEINTSLYRIKEAQKKICKIAEIINEDT